MLYNSILGIPIEESNSMLEWYFCSSAFFYSVSVNTYRDAGYC